MSTLIICMNMSTPDPQQEKSPHQSRVMRLWHRFVQAQPGHKKDLSCRSGAAHTSRMTLALTQVECKDIVPRGRVESLTKECECEREAG